MLLVSKTVATSIFATNLTTAAICKLFGIKIAGKYGCVQNFRKVNHEYSITNQAINLIIEY